jgi:hypothetical protein
LDVLTVTFVASAAGWAVMSPGMAGSMVVPLLVPASVAEYWPAPTSFASSTV